MYAIDAKYKHSRQFPNTMSLIAIDGSMHEGGGQIIRTAMALSCLTGKGFKAVNIRKGRAKAGLKMQHVSCGTALQKLCNAKSSGLYEGSMELESGQFFSVPLRRMSLEEDPT